MPAQRKWTEERLAELRTLAAQGFDRAEIARRIGVDVRLVREAARYWHVELKGAYRRWDDATLADVVQRIKAGWSVVDVAEALRCNPDTLQSVLYQRGVVTASVADRLRWIAERRENDSSYRPGRHNAIRSHAKATKKHRAELAALVRAAERTNELHPLLRAIDRHLNGLPTNHAREDVRHDVVVAVLEGETLDAALVRRCRNRYATVTQCVSLDEPIPGFSGRRLLHEVIADPRAFDPSD